MACELRMHSSLSPTMYTGMTIQVPCILHVHNDAHSVYTLLGSHNPPIERVVYLTLAMGGIG